MNKVRFLGQLCLCDCQYHISYLSHRIIDRQLSADIKSKTHKNNSSFVSAEGRKAQNNNTGINLRIFVFYGHTKSKITLAKNFSNFNKPTSSVRLKGKFFYFFYLSMYLSLKRKRENLMKIMIFQIKKNSFKYFCFVFLNFNLT